MLNATFAIELASKHVGSGSMVSSAQVCLADAQRLNDCGATKQAHARALKSLAYSIGIFHADYRLAAG